MSYEALSTYIRAETSVFLQVCCAEERDVLNRECVGELIVNIGGLRRHLLPTAPSPPGGRKNDPRCEVEGRRRRKRNALRCKIYTQLSEAFRFQAKLPNGLCGDRNWKLLKGWNWTELFCVCFKLRIYK